MYVTCVLFIFFFVCLRKLQSATTHVDLCVLFFAIIFSLSSLHISKWCFIKNVIQLHWKITEHHIAENLSRRMKFRFEMHVRSLRNRNQMSRATTQTGYRNRRYVCVNINIHWIKYDAEDCTWQTSAPVLLSEHGKWKKNMFGCDCEERKCCWLATRHYMKLVQRKRVHRIAARSSADI